MVSYSDDKKYAFFGGIAFCRDDNTGYYLNSTTHQRLHRCVYEKEHGVIPDGYHVHHIDHDKGNNEPENLELLSPEEHSKRHGAEMEDELRDRHRDIMLSVAIPAAAEWHKSEVAKEWHKKQYERTKDALYAKKRFVCKECGKEYEATNNGKNTFCCEACASKWRRKSGLDDEQRFCAFCGKPFVVNRYKKTKCCSGSCANRLRHTSK